VTCDHNPEALKGQLFFSEGSLNHEPKFQDLGESLNDFFQDASLTRARVHTCVAPCQLVTHQLPSLVLGTGNWRYEAV
jgi:hypothetical protein